jgi:demethylmenaquinone methyltransferase/2-methoxy-6-polyprenyl-1,4-benzoquinol methylase
MFDGVAKHYDRTNNVLSAGNAPLWRFATVRAVDPQQGELVLDIAAGTGTSSAALAKSGATVTALDFSSGMVAEGRRKHPDIEFVEANAEHLPFKANTFDAVTISFGLRNVNNPRAALAEMYRVLKPGGRLVICEFSKPPRALLRASYYTYLQYVMPTVVGATSSNPEAYTYLAESIKAWPDQTELNGWLRGAGFTRVAYRNLTAGVVALHRGRKPVDAAILASVAKRKEAATRPIGVQKPASEAAVPATKPAATKPAVKKPAPAAQRAPAKKPAATPTPTTTSSTIEV